MSILDYSHVISLGVNCTPCHQLTRVATLHQFPESRFSGPFDWCGVRIGDLTRTVASRFANYFNPESCTIFGMTEHSFKVRDSLGCEAWHILRRTNESEIPSKASWRGMKKWVDRRVANWNRIISDPSGKILFVRFQDVQTVETEELFLPLIDSLSEQVAGQFTIAAIAIENELSMNHPRIKPFSVPATWPLDMHADDVDWDKDYGLGGVAWKSHDLSWDKIWAVV